MFCGFLVTFSFLPIVLPLQFAFSMCAVDVLVHPVPHLPRMEPRVGAYEAQREVLWSFIHNMDTSFMKKTNLKVWVNITYSFRSYVLSTSFIVLWCLHYVKIRAWALWEADLFSVFFASSESAQDPKTKQIERSLAGMVQLVGVSSRKTKRSRVWFPVREDT